MDKLRDRNTGYWEGEGELVWYFQSKTISR